MVRPRTRLTICVSSSRGLFGGEREEGETRNEGRGCLKPEQFKEIAGTATRECSGQSEVADTTDCHDGYALA